MSLTSWQKVIAIIAGVLTISTILFSAVKSYAALYIDSKIGVIEYKVDSIIKRLDDNGIKEK